uniref:Uncharacterized protein n=1 Tax=Rhabditophanes sp. KR3021 TaxID=114890 RepID=A0AC35TMF8_9BILA
MLSTNNKFMLKALSAHHVYEACVKNILAEANLASLTTETFHLFNTSNSNDFENVLVPSNHNLNEQTVELHYKNKTMMGLVFKILFNSEESFIRIMKTMPPIHFLRITKLTIGIGKHALISADDFSLGLFAGSINYLLLFTKNIHQIKFHCLLHSNEKLSQEDVYKYIKNLQKLISFLKLRPIVEKIIVDCTAYLEFLYILIREEEFIQMFEKYHKNIKDCEFHFVADMPVGGALISILDKDTPSKMISYLFKCNKDTVNEVLLLEENISGVRLKYTPNNNAFSDNDLHYLLGFKYEKLCWPMGHFITNLFEETLTNRMKHLTSLVLMSGGLTRFQKLCNTDVEFETWKKRLLIFSSLKELSLDFSNLDEFESNCTHVSQQEFNLHEKELNRIKYLICAFPPSIEKLFIFCRQEVNDCGDRIAKAYPFLKFLKINHYTFDGHSTNLTGYSRLPSNYFESFENLQVLRLNCIEQNDLIFPKTLRILEINCSPYIKFNYFYFRKVTIENIQTLHESPIRFDRCHCHTYENIFRHMIIRRDMHDQRSIVYLANLMDIHFYNRIVNYGRTVYCKNARLADDNDSSFYGLI